MDEVALLEKYNRLMVEALRVSEQRARLLDLVMRLTKYSPLVHDDGWWTCHSCHMSATDPEELEHMDECAHELARAYLAEIK